MADPRSTPVDTDNQLIATEAALRRANRDQIDAATMLDAEQTPVPCNPFKRLLGKCP